MAAISALSTSLYSSIPHRGVVPRSFRPIPRLLSLSLYPLPSPPRRRSLFLLPSKPVPASWRSLKAVAEGEAAASEEEQAAETVAAAATTAEEEEDATVAVPVSPSDMLTMFFQAEGTMDESAISGVSKAIEGQEGISDLNVRVAEGIATVELTKQTTVQATGVASNLVEIIQGAGFKLQALNLSFEDEEDAVS
ncbi:hypothetical protein OPV22_030062 [Ensete ventricosum]|uniref:HMA domain-containing protein n=1 Tax=Ensete ventricosum TaxID=4639 RepID=A0AAV8QF22_ENSVE|nr:hypothetical protein OPV22_030062 [Ensete ventricosum]